LRAEIFTIVGNFLGYLGLIISARPLASTLVVEYRPVRINFTEQAECPGADIREFIKVVGNAEPEAGRCLASAEILFMSLDRTAFLVTSSRNLWLNNPTTASCVVTGLISISSVGFVSRK
jgi:hypothetical protein